MDLQNIVENVRQLFFRYGIKSITMDDIARELGISKKTLYQFVVDKTDMVEKVFENEISICSKQFESALSNSNNAIEELVAMHKELHDIITHYNPVTFFDLKKYYPDLYKKYLRMKFDKLYEYFLQNIKQGKAQGLYRYEMNEEIIAKHTVSKLFYSLYSDNLDFQEEITPGYFTEILIYHIRGIASDKGLKVLEENMDKLMEYSKYGK
jgi:AcrR family transcriptional regulator